MVACAVYGLLTALALSELQNLLYIVRSCQQCVLDDTESLGEIQTVLT
jgi:hypothetical protein